MRSLIFLLFASAISTFGQSSADLVISQIFGGGGNPGAPFRKDFIELFNRGKNAVNVSGWSVQYASSTETDWQVTPISGLVAPGRYFLIQQAIAANTAASALPDPDATGSIAMSATAANLALVRNSTPVTGATPSDAVAIR